MPPSEDGCCCVVWPKRLGVVLEGWLEPNKGFEPNIDPVLTACQYTSPCFAEYTCLENAMVAMTERVRRHVP